MTEENAVRSGTSMASAGVARDRVGFAAVPDLSAGFTRRFAVEFQSRCTSIASR